MITATRFHDFSCGHRIVGHQSGCARLHGHNYRVHFTVAAASLDDIGRVIDFSAIKDSLCEWLELNWDHRMLLWNQDTGYLSLAVVFPRDIVLVPFNPTAENMAQYLLEQVGPWCLPNGIELVRCTVEETRKCSATAELSKKE